MSQLSNYVKLKVSYSEGRVDKELVEPSLAELDELSNQLKTIKKNGLNNPANELLSFVDELATLIDKLPIADRRADLALRRNLLETKDAFEAGNVTEFKKELTSCLSNVNVMIRNVESIVKETEKVASSKNTSSIKSDSEFDALFDNSRAVDMYDYDVIDFTSETIILKSPGDIHIKQLMAYDPRRFAEKVRHFIKTVDFGPFINVDVMNTNFLSNGIRINCNHTLNASKIIEFFHQGIDNQLNDTKEPTNDINFFTDYLVEKLPVSEREVSVKLQSILLALCRQALYTHKRTKDFQWSFRNNGSLVYKFSPKSKVDLLDSYYKEVLEWLYKETSVDNIHKYLKIETIEEAGVTYENVHIPSIGDIKQDIEREMNKKFSFKKLLTGSKSGFNGLANFSRFHHAEIERVVIPLAINEFISRKAKVHKLHTKKETGVVFIVKGDADGINLDETKDLTLNSISKVTLTSDLSNSELEFRVANLAVTKGKVADKFEFFINYNGHVHVTELEEMSEMVFAQVEGLIKVETEVLHSDKELSAIKDLKNYSITASQFRLVKFEDNYGGPVSAIDFVTDAELRNNQSFKESLFNRILKSISIKSIS